MESDSNKSSKTKASRGRPKTIDRNQTITVAMQAYWQEDVDTVSLNEICRRAAVSKPSLYREFGNEDGLMKAVLEAYQTQVLTPIYQMIAADRPFQETLNNLIEVVTSVSDDPETPKGCYLVKLRESYAKVGEATQGQADLAKEEALSVYEDWVDRAKANGEFSIDMPSRFAAIYIDAQLNNAFSLIARDEPNQEVKEILTLAFSMFG